MRQLTLIVTLIWLSHAAPPAPATSSLIQVTDHLSVIARLVNGIALQNGFSSNLTDFNDFIAELLDLESGDSVEKMMGIKIDVNTANGYLETILGGVKGLAKNPVGDSTKVKEAFQSLEKMKTKLKDLKSGEVAGSTKTYESAADNLSKKSLAVPKKFFDMTNFKKAAEKLNLINKTPTEDSHQNSQNFVKAFEKIEDVTTPLVSDLKYFKTYKADLKDLFAMKGKANVLKPVKELSDVAQEYQKNTAVFSSLPTTMKSLKDDSDTLLPLANKHADFNFVSVALKPVLDDLAAISGSRSADKVLASGFPNGGKDFEGIFKDLKSEWIKKNIADGGSVEKLEKALSSIQKWVPKMVQMSSTREKHPSFTNLGVFATQLADLFGSIAGEGEALSKSQNLKTSIDTLSGSISSLKPITGSPEFQEFEKLYAYATDIDTKIQAIENVFKDADPKIDDDLVTTVGAIADLVALNSQDTTMNIAEKVKALAKFNDLVNVVNAIVTGMEPYAGEVFVNLVKNPPGFGSIQSVQGSLKGTELVATLDKLQTLSYDSNGIHKMLSFGINIRKVQGSADDISYVKNSLSVIDQLKTDVAEVKKVMSSKPGSSRRRRKPSDSEALKKLEGSQTVASSIGRGVNLLRNLAQAHQKKGQLIAAADSDADVNTAIASVPKAQSSWTDDNRKGLKKMVDQLDGLEKYASENKDKELMVLGSVLQKASEIQGVPIDTKILKDDVLPILKASGNQKVKDAVPVFQDVSDLELDYSKHSTTLQRALNSLNQLRDFFDVFFSDVPRESDKAPEAEAESGMMTIILICIGSVVGVMALVGLVVCVIVSKKKKKQAKKGKNNKKDGKKKGKKGKKPVKKAKSPRTETTGTTSKSITNSTNQTGRSPVSYN